LTPLPAFVIKVTEGNPMSRQDEPVTKRDLQGIKQEIREVKRELGAMIDEVEMRIISEIGNLLRGKAARKDYTVEQLKAYLMTGDPGTEEPSTDKEIHTDSDPIMRRLKELRKKIAALSPDVEHKDAS
jgi:uncharacterized protein YdhG (YjbR/CyaY superfamily)